MRADVSNTQVGKDLGVTHATVSRLRSGDRRPSLDLMLKIERAFGWKLNMQAAARGEGKYPARFEEVLAHRYQRTSEFNPPVASSYGR